MLCPARCLTYHTLRLRLCLTYHNLLLHGLSHVMSHALHPPPKHTVCLQWLPYSVFATLTHSLSRPLVNWHSALLIYLGFPINVRVGEVERYFQFVNQLLFRQVVDVESSCFSTPLLQAERLSELSLFLALSLALLP